MSEDSFRKSFWQAAETVRRHVNFAPTEAKAIVAQLLYERLLREYSSEEEGTSDCIRGSNPKDLPSTRDK